MATLKVEQQFFFRHIKVDMKKKEIFFLENSFGPDLAQAFSHSSKSRTVRGFLPYANFITAVFQKVHKFA